MVGDLKNGRTVHSLSRACAHFNIRLFFVSPEHLEMPTDLCMELRGLGVKYSFHRTIEEVIPRCDVVYMTRMQKERMAAGTGQIGETITLTTELLQSGKDTLKVLHPLPRLGEIPQEIDESPYAYYFQQAGNGLWTRQALMALLLRKI